MKVSNFKSFYKGDEIGVTSDTAKISKLVFKINSEYFINFTNNSDDTWAGFEHQTLVRSFNKNPGISLTSKLWLLLVCLILNGMSFDL